MIFWRNSEGGFISDQKDFAADFVYKLRLAFDQDQVCKKTSSQKGAINSSQSKISEEPT